MKRGIIMSLAVLAVWGGAGLNYASAQFGTLGQSRGRAGSFTNPSTSTFQGGNFNTYGILRPPFDPSRGTDPFYGMQRLNPDGSLQGQLANQGATNALGGLQTGHGVTFFDYCGYFPSQRSPTFGSSGQGIGSHLNNNNNSPSATIGIIRH
jgi:hypothetical protein